jgi:hypothetical protein
MHIHAASIAEAVPRGGFEAVVHSVFESAVNLRLTREDRLITVLISDRHELPQGIRIEAQDAPLQTLCVGQRANARDGILRFDSSPLVIDLRDAPAWICRVRELGAEMKSSEVRQAWSAAWELLNREQRLKGTDIIAGDLFRLGMGTPLSRRMSGPVQRLIASAAHFDLDHAIRSAGGMIGLGPGVTPSGDDILLGILAGLWSAAGEDERRLAFLRAFGEALVPLARQTGEISRTYLHHATLGRFSSSLSLLAQAITQGGQVQEPLEGAMRVGHSSGMDSATGLLIGLSIGGNPALARFDPWSTPSTHHD